MNGDSVNTDREIPEGKYASRHFGKDLVGAPAMVMALGIFLLFSGPFLLELVFQRETSQGVIYFAAAALGIFSVYLFCLFVVQAFKDRGVIWSQTPDHFRIGTWVAGTNVLARVVDPVVPGVGKPMTVVGWILWLLFMVWLSKILRHPDLRQKINGSAFLTTVATQSVVLSTIAFWPSTAKDFPAGFLALNLFGVLLYVIWSYSIWVARGVQAQIANWVPANNITHGALSISVLAAESIAGHLAQPISYFLWYVQALWIIATLFFVVATLTEAVLVFTKKKNLFSFQVGNYARNFTYGMFFACTYYGYKYLPGSIMHAAMSGWMFIGLAMVVMAVNVWELGHQIVALRIPATANWPSYARRGIGEAG